MQKVIVESKVSELNVQCMYQVRNFNEPGFAASDGCGAPATNAVLYPDGKKLWRCEAHNGQINAKTSGISVRTIERLVDAPLEGHE